MPKLIKRIADIASQYQLLVYSLMLIASIIIKVNNNDTHNDYYNDYNYSVYIYNCADSTSNNVEKKTYATCKSN